MLAIAARDEVQYQSLLTGAFPTTLVAGCLPTVNLTSEANISVVDSKALLSLFGPRDQHLRQIRDALAVKISAREDRIHIEGEQDAVARATQVIEQLTQMVNRQGAVAPDEVSRVLATVNGKSSVAEFPPIEVLNAGRKISPRTAGQARYLRAHGDVPSGQTLPLLDNRYLVHECTHPGRELRALRAHDDFVLHRSAGR